MRQIVLLDTTRNEIGYVRIDCSVGRIEAYLQNDSSGIEGALNELLTSVAEANALFISRSYRQDDKVIETREKISLNHPQALNALADVINRNPNWPQRIFAVIQNREEA